jgi:hypothetical protein
MTELESWLLWLNLLRVYQPAEQVDWLATCVNKFWLHRLTYNRIGPPDETFYQPMYTDLVYFGVEIREPTPVWWPEQSLNYDHHWMPGVELEPSDFNSAILSVYTERILGSVSLHAHPKDREIMRGYYCCLDLSYPAEVFSNTDEHQPYIAAFRKWEELLNTRKESARYGAAFITKSAESQMANRLTA